LLSCILAIDDRPINRQFLVSLLGTDGTQMEALMKHRRLKEQIR